MIWLRQRALVIAATALLVAACAVPLPSPSPAVLDSASTSTSPPEPAVLTGTATPPITPIEELGVTGTPVQVDIDSYRLVVDGLVARPLSLTYSDLLGYPAVTRRLALVCPGFFVNHAEWTGPLVSTILAQADIRPGASEVEFSDGSGSPYRRSLTLEEALSEDTLLAYKVNGETLPVEHGYPLWLVVGSRTGGWWVKWLFHIEVR